MSDTPTILFAGGGTGGHIFPNLAVIERLREQGVDFTPRLLVSRRAIDRGIVEKLGVAYTALPARPMAMHPLRLAAAYGAYRKSVAVIRRLCRENNVKAVVGTGGFVSGPAMAAGASVGVPTAMVNLDAVPGRANRMMAKHATQLFTAHDTPALPGAKRIGVPLRPAVLRETVEGEARRQLGLDSLTYTLLVTAGSQGARSINAMMLAVCKHRGLVDAFRGRGWSVLHQSGEHDGDALRAAYDEAGIASRVVDFIDDMGLAWSAAEAAVSRAGAGSAAEVWARAVPAVFLPYPYHKDQHQKLNAQPLVDAGGALLGTDHVDAEANLNAIAGPLGVLLGDDAERLRMRAALHDTAPADGAVTIAEWVRTQLGD